MKKRIKQQLLFLAMSLFILSCSDNFNEIESNKLKLENLKEKYNFTTILHTEEPEYLKDLEPMTLEQIESFLDELIIPDTRTFGENFINLQSNNPHGIDVITDVSLYDHLYASYIEPTEKIIMNSVVAHSSWGSRIRYMHDYDNSYVYNHDSIDFILYSIHGNTILKTIDSTGVIELKTRTLITVFYDKINGEYVYSSFEWNL